MKKIMIVEDDPMIVQLLKGHLSKHYQVASVQNFRAVRQEIEDQRPDIVLMDIGLPYYNGFYWTTEIRKSMTMPILFLSSSDSEMDMVMAINMGGDDYMTKPFSLALLDAKIGAFLRRVDNFSPSKSYSFGPYLLDLEGKLTLGDQYVHLTPTELRILTTLFEAPGQVVTKDRLLEKLWENENFIDQNTLNVNMTRLRKKLGQIGFDHLHTVRGVGYVLQ